MERACLRRSVTKIDARCRSIQPLRDDGFAVFGEDHGPRNPVLRARPKPRYGDAVPNVLGIEPAAQGSLKAQGTCRVHGLLLHQK